jgi:hypothetical protein
LRPYSLGTNVALGMLETPDASASPSIAAAPGAGDAPTTPARLTRDELSPLAAKLDTLSNALFWVAGVVFVCAFLGALFAASTNVDTLGLLTPQAESHSRLAIVAIVFGTGFAAAGVVAGLAGILKALVRRRDV